MSLPRSCTVFAFTVRLPVASTSDEEVAAVLSYIRNEWGNKGSFVMPETVKKVRDATKDKSGAWTADELKQVPEQGQ